MKSARLILYAHGSADPKWRAPFEAMLSSMRRELGVLAVDLCYMEFAEPSLATAVSKAANDRLSKIIILPLFLSAGAHVSNDIPRLVDLARKQFPNMLIEVSPPIGEHPRVQALFQEIAAKILTDDWTSPHIS